jgi:deoxyribose-phosphate aldolase
MPAPATEDAEPTDAAEPHARENGEGVASEAAADEATRNPGTPLDTSWVRASRVNPSATQRRAATLKTRRSIKNEWQAAWLLRAVSCLDLTTLKGDDTPSNVRRLCAKARQPVHPDLLRAMGMADKGLTVGAVCVYHRRVADAQAALEGSGIPVAAVSTGFPAGLSPFETRLDEIERSVAAGADEIDIVVTREHVLRGQWQRLYDEVRRMREACGAAHMKTILATGELGPLWQTLQASKVCMMAGADFIKTSTGMEKTNATLENGLVMTRAIREYEGRTGHAVGFKPAGGIRSAKEALHWLKLVKEELGDAWLTPERFRFGASSLLADIERQLAHHVTGRYAAGHRFPMG